MKCVRTTPFREGRNWPLPGEIWIHRNGSQFEWQPEDGNIALTLSSNTGQWIIYAAPPAIGGSYLLGQATDQSDPTELPDFEPI